MKKALWLKGFSCILVLLLVVAPILQVSATQEKPLVYSLFNSSGFTAECAKPFTTDGHRGLVFSGVAPASFSTVNTLTGNFSMELSSVVERWELKFTNKAESVVASLFSTSSAVTITVGDNSGVLEMGFYDVMSIEFSADEQLLCFSAKGNSVEFPVDTFDYVDYSVTYCALESYRGSADVCVYSINGSSLSKPVITNTETQLYMPIKHNGVRGFEYELEQPYVFDLLEGKSSDVSVSVTKDNKTIMEAQLWEPRMRFPTETSGYYTIVLSSGERTKEYQLQVIDKISDSELIISEEFPFATVGTGSVVTIPTVMIRNDLFGDTLQETQYTVLCNGEMVESVVGKDEDGSFCFEKPGEYQFYYYSTSSYLDEYYTFSVDVVEGMPAITYIWSGAASSVGQKYQLPSAQMFIDGKELPVNAVLHFPDGKVVSNDVLFTQSGIYQVEFRAEDNNQIYRYYAKLKVDEALHKTPNGTEYGVWTDGYFDEPVSGLMVELTNGESYEYGNIIDLSDNTSAYATFMKFFIMPYKRGTADFNGLQITLTDAYDESKYVLIDFVDGDGIGDAYIRMRGSNQTDMIGLQWFSDTRIRTHRNNAYGYHGLVSFNGDQSLSYPGSYSRMQFSLGYDISEQIVYGTHAWHSAGAVGLSRVMSRLADTDIYKDAFEGFTTGEVRMSIQAYNFNSSKGRILITDIDGQDLTKSTVADNVAPKITIDMMEYTEDSLPQAIVGKEYPVFAAQAMDAQCGNLPCDIHAYYMGEHRLYDVSVKDGKFVPIWEGDYTIRYSSEDYFGNVSEKELIVHAGSEMPASINWEAHAETAYTGQNVSVAGWSYTGGHGTVVPKSIKAKHDSGEILEISEGFFVPTKSGNYTICYEYEDYLGNITKAEYVLAVSDSKDPILNIDPVLPMAVLDGGTYVLPSMTAADYATGEFQEVSAQIWVEDAAGKRLVENGQYQASGSNGSKATISYVFTTATGELTKQYMIPVGNLKTDEDKMFDLAGLIISDDFETVVMEGKENYFISAKQDGRFLFARELLANGFDLKFNVGHQADAGFRGGDLNAIRLTLTDMENRDDVIHINIVPRQDDNSSLLVNVNEGMSYAFKGSFSGNTNYPVEINYNNETKAITVGGSLTVDIESFADGRAFTGFQSGKLYCSVDLIEVGASGALIEVLSLNGQPFSHGKLRDRIAPNFTLTAPMSVCYTKGEVAKLPSAIVLDVLSLNSYMKVSVQTPNREYVTAADGTRLEMADAKAYEIKLEQMGTYLVTFSIWDDNGGPVSTISRSIVVMDNAAPVLNATKDKISTTVGKNVAVNIFSASDDDGQEVVIHLFIQNSSGKMVAIDGESYTFETEGTYQLVAIAYDTVGNMARIQIPVEVGGA